MNYIKKIKDKVIQFYSRKIECSCFILVFSLFNLLYTYPFLKNINELNVSWLFIFTVIICQFSLYLLFFSMVLWNKTLKYFVYFFLFWNAFTLYFMLKFNTPIDTSMLISTMETNAGEISELFNWGLVFYGVGFGIIPCFLFHKFKVELESIRKRGVYIGVSLLFLVIITLLNGKNFTLLRRNRELLNYLPPFNYTFNSVNAIYKKSRVFITKNIKKKELIKITDENDKMNLAAKKPLLLIFLVGETTRAKNIDWNGYERKTMEFLQPYKNDTINFENWYSCNTSTFNSVPCMFGFARDFSWKKIIEYENYLHILKKQGFNLYWFSNNGGCKGVCENAIPDYKIIEGNDDMELLGEVGKIKLKQGNNAIYLHLRGSHGAEYYKRYPESFEYYKPACKEKEFRNCPDQEIINSYDNSIRYNGFVVSKIIDFLKTKEKDYNVVLFWVSDHGESLGEKGFYLHAAPIFLVKETQGHPISMLWIPEQTKKELKLSRECLLKEQKQELTHFNLFHSILGLIGIENKYYNKELDIFKECKK